MRTDSEIRKSILEELSLEPSLEAGEISVAVNRGEVILSGTLSSFYKKVAAKRAAKRIEGVMAITVDIEITHRGVFIRNDADLAELVINAIDKFSDTDDANRIKVKVESGIVTLEGNVNYKYQKKAYTSVVESVTGSKNVINNLVVKTRAELKQKTRNTFQQDNTKSYHNSYLYGASNMRDTAAMI